MAEDIFADAQSRMAKAVEALQRELQTVRTGRASPALVERLQVEYYGTPTPVQNMATVRATDARTLTIQPFEKSLLGEIEKAIQKSDLGLNPTNDGTAVRLTLPPLTEERRRDLVKVVHKKVEDQKTAVRNIRRDADKHLKDQEKKKEVSTDEVKRGMDRLQKLTDKYVDEIEKVGKAKENEILEI